MCMVPKTPLYSKNEGGGSLYLFNKVSWIPQCEVFDARSLAGLVLRREGGSVSPFPPQKREELNVCILRRGACLATLKVPS